MSAGPRRSQLRRHPLYQQTAQHARLLSHALRLCHHAFTFSRRFSRMRSASLTGEKRMTDDGMAKTIAGAIFREKMLEFGRLRVSRREREMAKRRRRQEPLLARGTRRSARCLRYSLLLRHSRQERGGMENDDRKLCSRVRLQVENI